MVIAPKEPAGPKVTQSSIQIQKLHSSSPQASAQAGLVRRPLAVWLPPESVSYNKFRLRSFIPSFPEGLRLELLPTRACTLHAGLRHSQLAPQETILPQSTCRNLFHDPPKLSSSTPCPTWQAQLSWNPERLSLRVRAWANTSLSVLVASSGVM